MLIFDIQSVSIYVSITKITLFECMHSATKLYSSPLGSKETRFGADLLWTRRLLCSLIALQQGYRCSVDTEVALQWKQSSAAGTPEIYSSCNGGYYFVMPFTAFLSGFHIACLQSQWRLCSPELTSGLGQKPQLLLPLAGCPRAQCFLHSIFVALVWLTFPDSSAL